jgi:hypothetical protein
MVQGAGYHSGFRETFDKGSAVLEDPSISDPPAESVSGPPAESVSGSPAESVSGSPAAAPQVGTQVPYDRPDPLDAPFTHPETPENHPATSGVKFSDLDEQIHSIHPMYQDFDLGELSSNVDVRDVGTYLSRGNEKNYVDPKDASQHTDQVYDRISDAMVHEAKHTLSEFKNKGKETGEKWYRTIWGQALRIARREFPELGLKHNKSLFTALVAITSNGANPIPNYSDGVKLYQEFKDTGVIPHVKGKEGKRTLRGGSINPGIDKMNAIIAHYGGKDEDGKVKNIDKGVLKLHEFLTGTYSIKEIKDELTKIMGKEAMKDFKNANGMKFVGWGSQMFGPKIGAYFANLSGDLDQLTMDTWFKRMALRHMGALHGLDESKVLGRGNRVGQAQKLKDAIEEQFEEKPDELKRKLTTGGRKVTASSLKTMQLRADSQGGSINWHGETYTLDELTDKLSEAENSKSKTAIIGETVADKDDILEDLEHARTTGKIPPKGALYRWLLGNKTQQAREGHTIKDKVNSGAKSLHDNQFGMKDPDNMEDIVSRNFARTVMGRALDKMNASGHNLQMADLQSILWHFEKHLYDIWGVNDEGRGKASNYLEGALNHHDEKFHKAIPRQPTPKQPTTPTTATVKQSKSPNKPGKQKNQLQQNLDFGGPDTRADSRISQETGRTTVPGVRREWAPTFQAPTTPSGMTGGVHDSGLVLRQKYDREKESSRIPSIVILVDQDEYHSFGGDAKTVDQVIGDSDMDVTEAIELIRKAGGVVALVDLNDRDSVTHRYRKGMRLSDWRLKGTDQKGVPQKD